ncbi:MAG: hypothetical protein ACF8TS_12330 [Maioricimonas sp. JB049]
MIRSLPSLILLFALTFPLAGCGGGDAVPEDAPPTPQPGSEEYDQYNNPGPEGPGSQHNAG